MINFRNLLTATIFAGCISPAAAQVINPKKSVINLEEKTGIVMVGCYNNAAEFPQKGKAAFFKSVKVSKQQQCIVTFDHFPEGGYAIAVFLDEMVTKNLTRIF